MLEDPRQTLEDALDGEDDAGEEGGAPGPEEALRGDPAVQRIIDKALARFEGLIPPHLEAVKRGLPLVKKRAAYWASRYRGLIERDAATAEAKAALMQAVHRHDPALDAHFEGYVRARIDGSILDLIRSSAGARRVERAMERAAAAMAEAGRPAYNLLVDDDAALEALAVDFARDQVAARCWGQRS